MNVSRLKTTIILASIGLASMTWRFHGLASTGAFIAASDATPPPFSSYLPLITQTGTLVVSPSWSAPIVVSPLDGSVWVVNPDAGSVSVIETDTLRKSAEVPVGQMPWSMVMAPDGRTVYVLDRAAGTLVLIDASTRNVRTLIPVGPEPGTLALTADGSLAYVSLTAADALAVLNTASLELLVTIPVAARPYAVAVSGEHVYVTHLHAFPRPGGDEARDDGREGHVTVIDRNSNTVVQEIILSPDEHGFPNLLMGITLRGSRAWVAQVRAAPDLPRGLTTTVFAAVSTLDLERSQEDVAARLPLNDQQTFGSPVNNPVMAVPAPDGQRLYIVLAGSNLVEVADVARPTHPGLIKFIPVGMNPRGMALSADGHWGYVMNYLSRSVTVLDLKALTRVAEVRVTTETLPPEVLQGKILFNSAADPRLSLGSWMSCASCHPDGGTDSVTWMFPDGPRQTPPLWNATQTLPWHWSAALDEAQDVEDTLQRIQHGLGLAPGLDPALLGTPNGSRSAALDALAAYLARDIPVPVLPPPETDGTPGQALFLSAGCAACHGGPHWTSSALPGPAGALDPDGNGMVDQTLREVGSVNARDVRGAAGFDPPSLLNVRLTAPYLHDGAMPTLAALLASGHPAPLAGGNGLSSAEITALVQFLNTLGVHTRPLEAGQSRR